VILPLVIVGEYLVMGDGQLDAKEKRACKIMKILTGRLCIFLVNHNKMLKTEQRQKIRK
jgi:hypothetical protein